ncbi:hypothetical protein IRJ41_000857 [Triplophysa rosa]|uniref:Protein eva-1-like protein C n=1 Tax=Triplophysa rosa TaxID=992332 RepID=A0A9W7TMY4_TRIRA|nr:hypothetical protein IRJ41_000857 [Triplophysa rosa]
MPLAVVQFLYKADVLMSRDDEVSVVEDALLQLASIIDVSGLQKTIKDVLGAILPNTESVCLYLLEAESRLRCEDPPHEIPAEGTLRDAVKQQKRIQCAGLPSSGLHEKHTNSLAAPLPPDKRVLIMPLVDEGTVTSVIVLCCKTLTEQDEQNLNVLEKHLTVACKRVQHMQRCSKQPRALTHNAPVEVKASTRPEDYRELDRKILQLCGELCDLDAASLQLKVIKYVVGDKVLEEEISFPLMFGRFGQVVETKKSIRLQDVSQEERGLLSSLLGFEPNSMLCVPVMGQATGQVVALACTFNKLGGQRCDQTGECRAHGNLGSAFFSKGNYRESLSNHRHQLVLAMKLKDRELNMYVLVCTLKHLYVCVCAVVGGILALKQGLPPQHERDQAGISGIPRMYSCQTLCLVKLTVVPKKLLQESISRHPSFPSPPSMPHDPNVVGDSAPPDGTPPLTSDTAPGKSTRGRTSGPYSEETDLSARGNKPNPTISTMTRPVMNLISGVLSAYTYITGHPERCALYFMCGVCAGLFVTLFALVVQISCRTDCKPRHAVAKKRPRPTNSDSDTLDSDSDWDTCSDLSARRHRRFERTLNTNVFASAEELERAQRLEERERIIREIWMNGQPDVPGTRSLNRYY